MIIIIIVITLIEKRQVKRSRLVPTLIPRPPLPFPSFCTLAIQRALSGLCTEGAIQEEDGSASIALRV